MKNNSSNIFYVYGYIRLDTNTYFYIGKGCKNRLYRLEDRNKHFLNIVNKVQCSVEILYDNLTENEAYLLEEKTIDDLVFNEGYSIDIIGFEKNKDMHLVNREWGGHGGISRTIVGLRNGNSNPVVCLNTDEFFDTVSMASKKYNVDYTSIIKCCNNKFKHAGRDINNNNLIWMYFRDYEVLKENEIKSKLEEGLNSQYGVNNPFYNKKHTDKTKELIRKIRTGTKQSLETKAKYNRKGELNNMYGRRGINSPHYGKHRTEDCKNKIAESNGTKIKCIELDRVFISLNQAEKILFEEYNIKINRRTLVNRLKPNSKKDWCGILIKDSKEIKLHWKYI